MRKIYGILGLVLLVSCNQNTDPVSSNHSIGPQATDYKYYLPAPLGQKVYNDAGNYHHPADKSIDFLPSSDKWNVIVAMRGGTVTYATNDRVKCANGVLNPTTCPGDTYYGNYVMVRHDDGTYALYAHLAKGSVAVNVGQQVNTGTQLGIMGETGNTSGPHLHVEVRSAGTTNGIPGNYEFGAVSPSFVEASGSTFPPGATLTSQNPGTSSPGPCPTTYPAAPSGLNPGDASTPVNITSQTVTLKWNCVNGATSYGIYVSKDPYGSANLVVNKDFVNGTSFDIPAGTLQPGVKYRWNMVAYQGSSNSTFTTPLYFQYNPASTSTCSGDQCYNFAPSGGWSVLVDDAEAVANNRGFEKAGKYPLYWWDEATSGGGATSTFTFSVSGDTDQNFAVWSFFAPSNGYYDVYAYVPKPSYAKDPYPNWTKQLANQVGYHVEEYGGTQIAPSANVNQNDVTEAGAHGRWVKIGDRVPYRIGKRYAVAVGDAVGSAPANVRIYFDSVALYKVGTFPDEPPAGYIRCASENQQCSFTGTADVIFGAEKTWTTSKTFTNGVTCNIANFGDPLPGVAKSCYYKPVPVATNPTWSAPAAVTLPAGTVGSGAVASQEVTVTNTGTGAGSFTATSSSPAQVGVNVADTSPVAAGGTRGITVTAPACTVVGKQSATITVSGGGSSAAIQVSRDCTEAPVVNTCTMPGELTTTMSSKGRVLLAWKESGCATYGFQATFDGVEQEVTGTAPSTGKVYAGAVATWAEAPDAADKQGKQLCFAIRGIQNGTSTTFSAPQCTTYRYYTDSIVIQSQGLNSLPSITIGH